MYVPQSEAPMHGLGYSVREKLKIALNIMLIAE